MQISQVIFEKTCGCGNKIIVTGTNDNGEAEISTCFGEMDKATGWLKGNCSVKCLCGKVYRMGDRRAWVHEIFDWKRQVTGA